ncbi:hypothetical protein LTR37_007382 [Vermiconidia calcicola]|uniref:Uncharacterized protein n=1 Tax=Vermiconidia calcicola TaxID=1690605 RepID=A0ACC3NDT3_9PEZI|nr:hypothetical protein LTR37_007382 [Vermiconidia calcicola]
MSTSLRSKWTHYDRIGADALNEIDILDYDHRAYGCFKLDDDLKDVNAQNYAWFAGEIHWGMYYSKTFEDPEKGIA